MAGRSTQSQSYPPNVLITNGQKLTILSQKVFCLTDFWRIFDPFAIMTIKKQWIFIRRNYIVFWPWPKLFFFSHHIFVINRAMTFILSVSKHIYSSYPQHIHMVVGYPYLVPNNMLNFKNVFIENFHCCSWILNLNSFVFLFLFLNLFPPIFKTFVFFIFVFNPIPKPITYSLLLELTSFYF